MNYKTFSSTGSENPASRESINRLLRSYPLKRKTYGLTDRRKKQIARKEKSEALRRAKE